MGIHVSVEDEQESLSPFPTSGPEADDKFSPDPLSHSIRERHEPSWSRRMWDLGVLLIVGSPVLMFVFRYGATHRAGIESWTRAELSQSGWAYLAGAGIAALAVGLLGICAIRWARGERKRAERLARQSGRLRNLASTDALTGTLARRSILEFAGEELKRAERYAYPVAALFVDVDDFKGVNDTQGHVAGDQVLRGVADLIRACVRDTDRVGRFGGDEFLVLMPHARDREALCAAERIRGSVASARFPSPGPGPISVTVSIGVVAGFPQGTGAEEFLNIADRALRRSKGLGKDRSTLWETCPARVVGT